MLAIRTTAIDLMVFAGVDAGEALAAVREGIRSKQIAPPPAASEHPMSWRRLLRRLRGNRMAG